MSDRQTDRGPLGPIEYPGMSVVVDAAGVQAPGYQFTLPGPEPESFAARWIYVNQAAWPGNHDLALFRKTVELRNMPRKVITRISADVCFRLYVNGVMVARGPDDIGSDIPIVVKDRYAISTQRWLYIVRDLTPHFRAGDNVIAAEVLGYGRAGAYLSAGRRGFWFDAQVTGAEGAVTAIGSDATWESRRGAYIASGYAGKALESNSEHVARVDLTYLGDEEPRGWLTGDDNADSWQPATEIQSVWEPMGPSEIPPCMEARYPVTDIVAVTGAIEVPAGARGPGGIRITGDGSFCLKVDRVIPAYVGFTIAGGAGGELVFGWEEKLGTPNRRAACVLRDGEQTFEFPGYGSCTYLRVTAHGVTSPVQVRNIQLVFTSQPVEYAGSFECSDTHLNALWKSSRYALQICMQTHHLDSPHHQEPISDPGDYLIEALMNYQAFGTPWLARQDLRKFAQVLVTVDYRNFHTSYALLWLQMLMDYYDHTGDRQTVFDLADQVHGLLDTFAGWCGANDLVCNAPDFMFMDWVDVAGFNAHHPPAVIGMGYLSAFTYQALANGIRVAELQHDAARAEAYRAHRASLHRAFNAVLWDDGRGLYRDGVPFVSKTEPYAPWLPADTAIETHTPHVNALAVLYDLAPPAKQAGIMRRVLADTTVEVQPYFMHFVFDALDHAGVFEDHAMALMRRWTIDAETQTCSEMWGRGDMSHAWNGTPLYQMSARILGVRPLAPGFSLVAVRPQPCGLDYAKGRVPTPHGPIDVEWQRTEGQLAVRVNAPDACHIDVITPTEPQPG